MTSLKRPFAVLGATALLSLGLTACGGYPTDASAKDFCGSVQDVFDATIAVEGEEPTKKEWEKIQKAYEDLGETGTPKNIGEDEREGFEVVVDAITDLDYDEAKKSFGDEDGEDGIPGVSKDDDKKADKFFEYLTTECSDELGGE
ncbi:hypothetical protein JK386_02255 [Nocardioides sp. zg-536]|uniref:Lipoprotein n=1 Tax=Nocardioides faecalis TaxID=2803858 RepID=A0A938Y3R0_9ACTN|nr:hypothetical protein [Nocardioides faecalis]MBM9458714.1 hypothetical protein [Nocardioides faecalis]QVI58702.1 hypothetical protein KG111_17350 [Nocardioides faecalis]